MTNSLKRTLTGGLLAAAFAGAVLVPAQASAADHVYGAIAVGMGSGYHASVDNYTSVLDAIDAAEKLCGASDCKYVTLMDGNCGVLAKHPVTGKWGWATGPTLTAAETDAVAMAGDGAEVKERACTAAPQS